MIVVYSENTTMSNQVKFYDLIVIRDFVAMILLTIIVLMTMTKVA